MIDELALSPQVHVVVGTLVLVATLAAALVSMGVDNVVVELNSPEVPIMDGSAAPFVYQIQEEGVKPLPAARRGGRARSTCRSTGPRTRSRTSGGACRCRARPCGVTGSCQRGSPTTAR